MTPYDSPDYWALIRRIREIDRAGGDSTLARLVTADWLQDHGEEARASFARVQVRYAQIHEDDTLERDELSELLLTRYAIRVATPTPFAPDCLNRLWPSEIHTGPTREWDWLSGWLSAVRCPFRWWLTHGPDICRRHPVREVVVTDFGVEICQWAQRQYDTVAVAMMVDGEFVTDPAVRYALALARHFSPKNLFVPTKTANAVALRWAESEADNHTPAEATL